ncbi:MAG: hypothetical protein R3B09_10555 [Nannocystaceae bacterium]
MTASKELVPVRESNPPDLYEDRYMAGQGTVLYRDKSRAPWFLHAMFGAAAAIIVAANLVAGQLLALGVTLPILTIVWLFFAVLRVTVSQGAVQVQYGLFGPTIPVAAIESATPVSYDWKSLGGWGIRRSIKGTWIYNMPGDGGRAVQVTWHDARGKQHVTLIGSRRAEDLAESIQAARAALPAAPDQAALPEGSDEAP